MHKSVLFYMTHKWNNDIASRFENVYNQINEQVDIILFHASYLKNVIPSKYHEISYSYDNQMLIDNRKDGYIDPFILYQHFLLNEGSFILDKYDYMYMYEYDQIYMGSLSKLFDIFENEDIDLIASYIEYAPKSWIWKQRYDQYFSINQKPFSDTYKCCLSFARISTKIIKELLQPKYKDFINSTIYELYIPTLAYHMGLKMKGLNILHNQFDWLDILNEKTYIAYLEFNSLNEIFLESIKYSHPMWFTRWK